MSDESLRDAFQSHLQAQAPATRAACPTPEALEQLARGAADGQPNIALLDHVLACAHCRPEFALLRSIAQAEETDTKAVLPARTASIWSVRNIAAAAVVLLAVGLGSQRLRLSRDAARDALRDGVAAGDASGVTLIAPLQTVNESSPRFVWHAVPGTERYTFEVVDTTGVVILTRETVDTSLTLSDADALLLRRQSAADWMVTARRVDGNERRSPVVRVQVAPSVAR